MLAEQHLARLLSLISHEVRAPLGVMRGYLRLLEQQGAVSEAHRPAVTAALRAGDRAAEILGQVSALARLESGEVVPARAPTPLPQLLSTTAAGLTLPVDPAVTIALDAAPDVSIQADEPLLRAALTGLISAVLRAQASDTTVRVHAEPDDHGALRGIAITATADRSPKPAPGAPLDLSRGGLGLDLALAVWIVDAHDGHVSEQRAGERLTGMVVWLPVA